MRRSLLAAALGLALAGCSVPRYSMVSSDDKEEFGVVRLGGNFAYLVDPRTQTCLLVDAVPEGGFAVPVSCAKLKASVPAAARFITWDASGEPEKAR